MDFFISLMDTKIKLSKSINLQKQTFNFTLPHYFHIIILFFHENYMMFGTFNFNDG